MFRRPILALAFGLTLLVPFVGCGGSNSPTEPMPVASQPTATASTAAAAAVEPTAGETESAHAPHAVNAGARARVDEGTALEERGARPSPVEPSRPEAPPAVAAVAAGNGHGNGGGHGGGNGGGNGGGHGPNPPGGPQGGNLSLAMQPDVWNTNWEHSQGTVSALIRGQDVATIDPSSIKLVGDATGGTPVSPLRVQKQGQQLRAFFAMAGALAALDTPAPGETHLVTIDYSTTGGGAVAHLTDTVRIVGPRGPGDGGGGTGELILVLQPDHWNTNWLHSAGTVSALIRGAGLADIDLGTVFLIGTDPAAAPLAALRASREGNHVRAFFAQSAAFATLLTPAPGKTYTIKIQFDQAGTSTTLTDTIRVVGPAL